MSLPLSEALHVAKALHAAMSPLTERIEIAGSIRRQKPEVKDIELVAIPRWTREADLFGAPTRAGRNHLHAWALEQTIVRWIKPGVTDIVDWPPQPVGRYWRGYVPGTGDKIGVKLDLFLPRPDSFGAQFVIRTGSADFTQAVMVRARERGLRFRDGGLYSGPHAGAVLIPTPDEETVFDALRLVLLPPPERRDADSVRKAVRG